MKLEIKKIGNSTGLILPKELVTRLGLEQGDTLNVIEEPDRSFRLTPYNQDDDETMELARQAMKDYKNALHELAK